jgi:hypothetical protein
MMLAGKGIIKREISQALRDRGRASSFCGAVETILGTHRFQRAVSAKDPLIGIRRPRTEGDAYPGLVPKRIPSWRTFAKNDIRD